MKQERLYKFPPPKSQAAILRKAFRSNEKWIIQEGLFEISQTVVYKNNEDLSLDEMRRLGKKKLQDASSKLI